MSKMHKDKHRSKRHTEHKQRESERALQHQEVQQEWSKVMKDHNKMSKGAENIAKVARTHGWNGFKEPHQSKKK